MIITAEPSFTYDGAYMKQLGYFLNNVVVSSPEISPENVNVPGRLGTLNMGNDIGSRQITLDVSLYCSSQEDFNEKRLYLENLVILQEPVEKPLVLDTDAQWTYYGQFTGISDFEWVNGYDYSVTLTFTCADPLKYGEQMTYNIANNILKFTPRGQKQTFPVIHAIAQKDATWCGLSTVDQFVYVGGKVDVETGETATTIYNPVLTDTAQNMDLWQRQSSETFTQVDNGTVGKGSYFQQSDDDINVKDFGENTGKSTEWYGPALKRMLTKQLANWKVTWRIQSMNNYKRAENKFELYLLDNAGKVIGKLGIKDNGEGSEQEINVQVYRADGSVKSVGQFKPTVKNKKAVALSRKQKVKKTDSKGKVTYSYITLKESLNENNSTNDLTDFYGYIEIEKVGNKFFATVVKLDTKNRNELNRWESVWTDEFDTFKKDLAGFVLYAGKRSITEDAKGISYKSNYLAFCDLKVYERAEIKEETILSSTPEVIIWEGDELIFDCERGRIYKNGQLFMDAMHIGTDFIKFIGGVQDEIVFAEGFDWTMHIRPTAL